ncbi:MAG TPA: D-glycero-beta-D-manno-heptose-7-phosphate kinase [Candidatus Baltobacteraceae bacterium]
MSGFLAQAQAVFRRARGRKVLVVGDLMIDEWIWGTVTRISPEAPVPVVAVSDHSFTLGGAGNVANNLRALNVRVAFAGTVGDDDYGRHVRGLLRDQDVDESGVFTLQGRPTTRKTRVVAHNQQVVRADWESIVPLNGVKRKDFAAYVRERAAHSDAVILSDYAKGLLSREVVEAALEAPLVLADPKPQNLEMFAGVTCVAPNVHEAEIASGVNIVDDKSLESAGVRLLRRLKCRYVVITRGEHGMALFGRNGERLSVPSVAHTVYDVSGAGDTVIATLGVALSTGATIKASMMLANYAAGAVVEKLGTATASPREILALVRHARP